MLIVKRTILAVLTAAAIGASGAQAATITGLYNTGTDASNVALANDFGAIDTHYQIVSSTSPGYAGQQAVTYYNGAYPANDADSKWVSLSDTGSPGNNTTTYRLTFDLTGLNQLTAQITGSWATDNGGTLLLNGAATGNNVANYNPLVNFSIASGFVAGVNHLDFVVQDFGAPTAFRVDNLAGTADLAQVAGGVPEPTTWALMLGGFGLMGAALRRRRAMVVA